MRRPARLALALAVAALVAPGAAPAVDVQDGLLSLHGDGQWAWQKTSGGNAFGQATPEGNYDTAMFDLVVTARPAQDLVVSAQLGFEPEGAGLEWGFAEWRFTEALRVRVGKVQQPFGNLNELRFAGTTRPLYHLPYSAYGPANVVGTAYLGIGTTGQLARDDGWALGYDAYGGAVTLDELEPHAAILHPLAGARLDAPVELEAQQVRDLVGGRLSLSTPGEVTVRVSGYVGTLHHTRSDERFYALGASLWYRGERLWLSAEAFRGQELHDERTDTAYATAGWMLTEHLQAAAQWEWARTTFPGGHGGALLRHDGLGVGLAWWFDPNLVIKAGWQRLRGNRFAFPEGATPNELAGVPDPATAPGDRTDVLTVGTQFSF